MTPLGNKIKSASEIKSSIKRIAYQVYENNVDESSLVVAGIGKRGGQEFVGKHLFERSVFYNKAHHAVSTDGKSIEEVVTEIKSSLA